MTNQSIKYLIGIDLGTTNTVVAYSDMLKPLTAENCFIFEVECIFTSKIVEWYIKIFFMGIHRCNIFLCFLSSGRGHVVVLWIGLDMDCNNNLNM